MTNNIDDTSQHNAAKVAGPETVKKLISEQLLGEKADHVSSSSLDYYTTTYRREIIFHEMKNIIANYLSTWYVP